MRGVSSEIDRLAKAGLPARDLFEAIGKAQEGLDRKVADLTTTFADQPAVLERVRIAFGNLELGGLSRELDAVVRGDQDLKEGSLTLIDTSEGLSTTWIPRMKNAGVVATDLARILGGEVPVSASVAAASVVTLTGDINDLAEAFHFAMTRAIGLATVIGSAVGGATLSPLATAEVTE